MPRPEHPESPAAGFRSPGAAGGRSAQPPMPRWLHPGVRVRRRSGVVCVEQRVPARVARAGVERQDLDGRAGGLKRTRAIRRYESGLTGAPSSLPLVRERLTVPLPAVGSAGAVTRAVHEALAAFRPPRGASRTAALPPLGFFVRLLQAVMLAGFVIIACAFTVRAWQEWRDPSGSPGAGDALASTAITAMLLVVAGLAALAAVMGRRAWLVRTPPWLAEDQWQLLRGRLARLAGQEPGSSRPLDIEMGWRRDLITHPGGERVVRGLTRSGLPGPAWPDRVEVARAARRARRGTAGLAVVLVAGLALAGLALVIPVSMGLFSPAPAPLLAYGILGAFVCVRLRRSDPVVLSRPRTAPGDREPVRIDLDRVDVAALPSWCRARRREDRWNALALLHGGLAGAVLACQVLVAVVLNGESRVAGGPGIGPAATAVPLAAFALTGAVGAWWCAARVRRRDAARRAAAGVP